MTQQTLEPKPAREVEAATHRFSRNGTVPNNSELPVLVMRGALPDAGDARRVRTLMEKNGWGGTWSWQVFPYHHYHPNAHEALAVAAGWADLTLGGPDGLETRVSAGDVIVLPAGTGHCQRAAADNFVICGAYPKGQERYETVRADAAQPEDVDRRIAEVALPSTDPVYGAQGPLMSAWAG